MLVVERAAVAHAGFYTCQAVGPSGQRLQLSVKLNVDTGGRYNIRNVVVDVHLLLF